MRRKVYSVNTELYKVTGVERVMMDVHRAICHDYDAKIVSKLPYEKVHKDHKIARADYIQMKSIFMFRHSIVIVHERKLLPLFWMLNHIFMQNIKLVYVHHNELYGHKLASRFPDDVVAISDNGVKNLTEYFHVPLSHIHKIHNCVQDIHPNQHPFNDSLPIRLLLPARINGQKQQLLIVEHLKEKLSNKIKILFAGTGPNYEKLKKAVEGDARFECLGYRSDIYDLLAKSDYMLLFSQHEGLPITLIEADMMGTPVICNDVGGNTEIVHDGKNGFIVNSWDDLIDCLNNLPQVDEKTYKKMSACGREIYEQYYTFDIFKKSYLNLLESLDE